MDRYICIRQNERSWHGGTVVGWELMIRDDRKLGKAFIYTMWPPVDPTCPLAADEGRMISEKWSLFGSVLAASVETE